MMQELATRDAGNVRWAKRSLRLVPPSNGSSRPWAGPADGIVGACNHANSDEIQLRWSRFLHDLPMHGVRHGHLADAVFRQMLKQASKPPAATINDDGAVVLTWGDGRKYMDIQVFSDGQILWCAGDFETLECDGNDDPEPFQMRGRFLDAIRRFSPAGRD